MKIKYNNYKTPIALKITLIFLILTSCTSYDKYSEKLCTNVYNMEFNGVVVKKFLSWNHGEHYLVIKDKSGKEYHLYLGNDKARSFRTHRSLTWEMLNVNYEVRKQPKSFVIEYRSKYDPNWKTTKIKYQNCHVDKK